MESEALDIVRWVVGVGFGLLSAPLVVANLVVLGLCVCGQPAPSRCPLVGSVFGIASLIVLPVQVDSLVVAIVLVVLGAAESAGAFRR